jgi:hypothetical protein
MHNLNCGIKGAKKCGLHTVAIFKKLPKVNNGRKFAQSGHSAPEVLKMLPQ